MRSKSEERRLSVQTPHLSRFGVYNDTSRWWCWLDTGGCRGSLVACEQSLLGFREEYPRYTYRIAQHAPDCCMSTSVHCCEPMAASTRDNVTGTGPRPALPRRAFVRRVK